MRTLIIATALAAATASISSAQLGTTYCSAVPNSTGTITVISASGSTVVAQNNFTLTGTDMPLNQFGLFVNGTAQEFVPNPGGSNGNLCVGGGLGRFNSGIVSSGASGSVSFTVDLNAVPRPSSTVAVMAGDTWYFQLWHRDTAGPGFSNFSEGLEVAFTGGQGSPTFAADIYPMLTQPNTGGPSCVTCHGGQCTLDFSTAQLAYNSLINVNASCCPTGTYVIPGDAANSLLWQKLTTPACGSPMPLVGTFAGSVIDVEAWINGGAPF